MNRIIAHRNSNGEKEFDLVELTRHDLGIIKKNLRARNFRLMCQCIKDARDVLDGFHDEGETPTVREIATALFDKLAPKLFNEEQKVLTRKTHWTKETHKAMASIPDQLMAQKETNK